MALLFDQNQGSFQDTGSQNSPVKKNTGIMRKEMSKLDSVAPRGHALAYITPEEAQVLNRGGGGVGQDGNQMMGPNGIPMYPGYDHSSGIGAAINDRNTGNNSLISEPNKDNRFGGNLETANTSNKSTEGIFDWAKSGKDNTEPKPIIIEEEDAINLTKNQLEDLQEIDLHGNRSLGKKWWQSNFNKPIKSSNFTANALMDIPTLGKKNVLPFVKDIIDEYMTAQEMLVRRDNVGRAETSGGAFDIAKNIYIGALIATKSANQPLKKGVTGIILNSVGQIKEVYEGGTVKSAQQDLSDNLDGVAFVTKYPNATREEILQYAEGKAIEKFTAQQNKITSGSFMTGIENSLFKMVGKDFLINL